MWGLMYWSSKWFSNKTAARYFQGTCSHKEKYPQWVPGKRLHTSHSKIQMRKGKGITLWLSSSSTQAGVEVTPAWKAQQPRSKIHQSQGLSFLLFPNQINYFLNSNVSSDRKITTTITASSSSIYFFFFSLSRRINRQNIEESQDFTRLGP